MTRTMMLTLLTLLAAVIWGCPTTMPNSSGNHNRSPNDNVVGNDNTHANDNADVNDNGTGGVAETLVALSINGEQEVPPIETEAAGSGTAALSADRSSLSFQFTAAGLSGPLMVAHFHVAPAGESGAPVFTIAPSFIEQDGDSVSIMGTWVFAAAGSLSPDEAVSALLEDNVYVNLHTAANPSGEIRGQLIYPDDDE